MSPRVTLQFDRGTIVVEGGVPAHLLASLRLVHDPRVDALRGDAVSYRQVCTQIRNAGLDFVDGVSPPLRLGFPALSLPDLRREQADALDAWLRADARGVVVMPTGAGKTVLALHAIARLGVSTLIVAPVRDLMYQWHARILSHLGHDAGIVGDMHHRIQPITVATYDSAWRHMDKMGDRFGLVIFDEVHHLPAATTREAALMCCAGYRLGLTATPERGDGGEADLDQLVGPIVHRTALEEIAGKTLADYHVVRIPVALTDEEQQRYTQACQDVRQYVAKRRREQPHFTLQDALKEGTSDPESRKAVRANRIKTSIEDRAQEKLRVLEDLFTLHAGQRIIVFAGSNVMAMDISRHFLVPTILSHTGKHERRAVLDGFAAGEMPILVANRVLDEGVDVPAAKVAIVVGGLSSTRQARQRLGRILRKSGAQRAVLYEVVTADTSEVKRSRARRRSDAYQRPRHSPV